MRLIGHWEAPRAPAKRHLAARGPCLPEGNVPSPESSSHGEGSPHGLQHTCFLHSVARGEGLLRGF